MVTEKDNITEFKKVFQNTKGIERLSKQHLTPPCRRVTKALNLTRVKQNLPSFSFPYCATHLPVPLNGNLWTLHGKSPCPVGSVCKFYRRVSLSLESSLSQTDLKQDLGAEN